MEMRNMFEQLHVFYTLSILCVDVQMFRLGFLVVYALESFQR